MTTADAVPIAPPGFKVELYASGLNDPRKILTAPNGDSFVVEMHKARQMARRDAAKVVVAPEKGRRNARGHRERVAEVEPDDVDDITHRFVHGQHGARERAIVEPQVSVGARDTAALQVEMIGPAGRRRHRIGPGARGRGLRGRTRFVGRLQADIRRRAVEHHHDRRVFRFGGLQWRNPPDRPADQDMQQDRQRQGGRRHGLQSRRGETDVVGHGDPVLRAVRVGG